MLELEGIGLPEAELNDKGCRLLRRSNKAQAQSLPRRQRQRRRRRRQQQQHSCFKPRGDGGPDAQQNKEAVKTDREGQQAPCTDSGSTQGSREEAVKADRSDRQAVNPASVAVKAAAKAGVTHRGWQQQLLHYCYIKFVDVASYLKP
jgi:hypothetical protein